MNFLISLLFIPDLVITSKSQLDLLEKRCHLYLLGFDRTHIGKKRVQEKDKKQKGAFFDSVCVAELLKQTIMAVVENAGININVVGSSNPGRIVQKDAAFDHHQSVTTKQNGVQRSKVGPTDQNFRMVQQETFVQHSINGNGVLVNHNMVQHEHQKMNGIDLRNGVDGEEGFKKEMRDLEEMFSKLNPMAEEFVPLSLTNHRIMPFPPSGGGVQFGFDNQGVANGNSNRRVSS